MAAPARSPNEKKSGGKAAPPHFLFQLAAALDNSTIKSLELLLKYPSFSFHASILTLACYRQAKIKLLRVTLEWHEDGKGILLHTKLYEEEIQQHQELFPEVKHLKSVPVLQAWLTTYGFKARMAKADSDVLIFQHPDFKKLPIKADETLVPKADVPLLPKQPKKSKKRKSTLEILVAPSASTGSVLPQESAGVERKSQRLRPLYQYINYDNPEMNNPSDKESDLPQTEVPPTLENKTDPLELRITSNIVQYDKGKELRSPISATSGAAVKTEVDKSTQVDIDKMLSVCAAHLVPPLSPQNK